METTLVGVCHGLMVLRWGAVMVALMNADIAAGRDEMAQTWVTAWSASAHGPYPMGNPSAQPEQKFAFPDPTQGARNQTLRMILRPAAWSSQLRFRFTNAFGRQPLTLDNLSVGLQSYAGNISKGSATSIRFGDKSTVVIAPGQTRWSDAVTLPFVRDAKDPLLMGRKLAVSFHVTDVSGPMTWHAKALQTSYVSAPGSGVHSQDEGGDAFIYTTASWFFVDAMDALLPKDTPLVVCFGDSITDGTGSTMNGDDRWPDVLGERLRTSYDGRVIVVNAGIGGNRVVGPADYGDNPIPGGPGALDRLERDVLSLSGVTHVIWLEGINDFGAVGTSVEAVTAGYREGVRRMQERGIKVIGATLTSALHATNTTHGSETVDGKRRTTNDFIRHSGLFDGVIDFDAATFDSATGEIQPNMQPNSTIGGAGDKLHPNRVGYHAMGHAIDLSLFAPTE